MVLGSRQDAFLEDKEPISSAWWTPLSFSSHPLTLQWYILPPFFSLWWGGHFAIEKLGLLNVNLLLIPIFLTHHSDKIWDFFCKLRMEFQYLLFKFNPRFQIASPRSKEFYPHWYRHNSHPPKSILSKSKLYCKSPKMEEIKWWMSQGGEILELVAKSIMKQIRAFGTMKISWI